MTIILDGTNGITLSGSTNQITFNDSSTQISHAVPQVTVYTSGSGTYTVPTNAKYLTVKMVGGGGGGGGGAAFQGTYSAGGGGAGGYIEAIVTPLSSTYAYAVGSGGAGGAAGTGSWVSAGGAGGSGVIFVTAYF